MHELSQNIISYKECARCEKSAGLTAIFVNLLLAVFKLIVGVVSGSKAVIGDSFYSFKDFLTSVVVFVGGRVSGKPADENHPYGHGKIEFVAIFLISILIIIGTFFLFIHSVKDVWHAYTGGIKPPMFIAFWAAIISMAANYKLSEYLYCVGDRAKSLSILANARHNHSDAISSALVAVAILATRFGLYFADPLAAVIETIDLIRLCWVMMSDALKGIMDSSVDDGILRRVEWSASLVPGVRRISSVKARKVGQAIWLDVVIKVDKDQTLDKGCQIGGRTEHTIRKHVENIAGINLAVEPYIT
jgi:cation diffusion facilitator family transporter